METAQPTWRHRTGRPIIAEIRYHVLLLADDRPHPHYFSQLDAADDAEARRLAGVTGLPVGHYHGNTPLITRTRTMAIKSAKIPVVP